MRGGNRQEEERWVAEPSRRDEECGGEMCVLGVKRKSGWKKIGWSGEWEG